LIAAEKIYIYSKSEKIPGCGILPQPWIFCFEF